MEGAVLTPDTSSYHRGETGTQVIEKQDVEQAALPRLEAGKPFNNSKPLSEKELRPENDAPAGV